MLVDVIASGLHPRLRSHVDGSHYTSSEDPLLVPGIDGVGRAPDGALYYFVLSDTTMGARAEQTVIDLRRSVLLPGLRPGTHRRMNPAMSSWVRRRVGRRPDRLALLPELGADVTLSLTGNPAALARRLGEAACDIDVVLDHAWGQPAAEAMRAIVLNRTEPGQPLTWIQVGSVAGTTSAIPSAALRAAKLQIVGSGQGSVPTNDIWPNSPIWPPPLPKGSSASLHVPSRSAILKTRGVIRQHERIVITP